MSISALIVAGGGGKRFLSDTPKQYAKVGGIPVIRHTIEKFMHLVDSIMVVINPNDEELYLDSIQGLDKVNHTFGGSTRQESVHCGLKALTHANPDKVLIHDAVRPFVSNAVISRVINALDTYQAVDLGVPIVDTIKNKQNTTIDRDDLYATQTPQGFKYQTVCKLHDHADGRQYTDDIGLCIDAGIEIGLATGQQNNIKITYPEDLEYAKYIMEKQQNFITRVGMGFDVHKFDITQDSANEIKICGISVPHPFKIIAHSDGDVGLHALTDAILGAIGEGDIGTHFPPSDIKWKNADSSIFVKKAVDLVKQQGGEIINVDITIIAEEPKIKDYKDIICQRVAELLEIDEKGVSLKGTTTEKLGFLGRKEGIAAQAVCSVQMRQ